MTVLEIYKKARSVLGGRVCVVDGDAVLTLDGLEPGKVILPDDKRAPLPASAYVAVQGAVGKRDESVVDGADRLLAFCRQHLPKGLVVTGSTIVGRQVRFSLGTEGE